MKCKICGAEMSEGNNYCLACGAKLDEAPAAPAMDPNPTPAMGQPTFQPINSYQSDNAGAPPAMGAAAPPTPRFFDDNLAPIVTVGHWMLTLLLLIVIPIAAGIVAGLLSGLIGNPTVTTILSTLAGLTGLIMMIVWAFNKRTNPSKRNFFRAALIYTVILVVLVVVVVLAFSAYIVTYINQLGLTDPQQLLQMFQSI